MRTQSQADISAIFLGREHKVNNAAASSTKGLAYSET
jgi:hypothetical protein